MGALGETGLAIAALALLWLGIAAAIAVVAARRLQLAQHVLGAAQANARLLELMPARPLVVRPDKRIEADSQLLRELGLEGRPGMLDELAGNASGLDRQDLDALTADVEG